VDAAGPDQAASAAGGASPVCLRRRLRVVWVVLIVAAFAGVAVKSDAAAAASAVVRVSITEQGFSPAVVVVPTGTVVQWQNNGSLAHSLSGQVRSPSDLQPGETYQRRFTTPGEYSYLDGRHPDSGGTVVVVAGSSRPPHAHGNATYHYSARLKLSVDDQWTYYDSEWDSKSGPCDAQIGSGERLIHLNVQFPNVTYVRLASIGVEALTSPEVRGRFGDSGETIKSQIAGNSSPDVTCPDGSTGPTANQPANCYRSFTGKSVRLNLSWGPSVTKNRFLFSNFGPAIQPGSCGSNIIGALVLVGVKGFVLPLNLVGNQVNYDEGQTNSATFAGVQAIRAGRAFTVNRRVDLNFTTPCCEGWAPTGGNWARTANIHRYIASLTISFKPRG
jgi:plastocyanin